MLFIIPVANAQDDDGDGLPNSVDSCPNRAGPRENNGCPLQNNEGDDQQSDARTEGDRDGDGTIDVFDLCPDIGGPNNNDGCPEGMQATEDPEPQTPVFIPPRLPVDGPCLAATRDGIPVRIRREPNMDADVVGRIDPTQPVVVMMQLETDDGAWILTPRGWSAAWVLRFGEQCNFMPLSDECVAFTYPLTLSAERLIVLRELSPPVFTTCNSFDFSLFELPESIADCFFGFVVVRLQNSPYTGPADVEVNSNDYVGTFCNEIIVGNNNLNIISGGGGHDVIIGFNGADELYGDAGNDNIIGGNGDDRIFGGPGSNILQGLNGDDYLVGHNLKDTLNGDVLTDLDSMFQPYLMVDGVEAFFATYLTNVGDDTMLGADFFDRFWAWYGSDFIQGGGGDDRIHLDGNDDYYNGDEGDDLCGFNGDTNANVPCESSD